MKSNLPSCSTQNALPEQAEVKKLWLFKAVDLKSPIEMRAIKGKEIIIRIFKGSQFESIDNLKSAFENQAIAFNKAGYNIYVVMNPIHENFTGHSASDRDIACRSLLLIDIDRKLISKAPANQIELDAALALATDITQHLKSLGWGEPVKMMSGNGYHLYYFLNQLPNDEKHRKLVADILQKLTDFFENNIVKVDTVVSNASRITKVPGTIAYKGTETPARPYRMARVLS